MRYSQIAGIKFHKFRHFIIHFHRRFIIALLICPSHRIDTSGLHRHTRLMRTNVRRQSHVFIKSTLVLRNELGLTCFPAKASKRLFACLRIHHPVKFTTDTLIWAIFIRIDCLFFDIFVWNLL